MDPEKVKGVTEWPTPMDRKSLQRFLCFANFYRRFIRNYSTIATSLTALTSSKIKFAWDEKAERAFSMLKSMFASVPILVHPDPEAQFIVEVDTSNIAVGAVLSQRSPRGSKLQPCAFLSHRVSAAEQNYDIGNRELLAVKMALEEWCHWLEGPHIPFQVWTDHKYLQYGLTISIWSTYRPPSASPHTKPGGLCSSGTLTSTSPTDLAPRIPSLMPCHITSTPPGP